MHQLLFIKYKDETDTYKLFRHNYWYEMKTISDEYPVLEMPSGNSLMNLLDIVLLLYHLSSHTQLSKVCRYHCTSVGMVFCF